MGSSLGFGWGSLSGSFTDELIIPPCGQASGWWRRSGLLFTGGSPIFSHDRLRPALDFLFLFAYAGVVSSSCRVSFEDGAGVTHTVSVAASSLYEAAALGVAEFKRCGFAMAAVGPGTQLKIAVEVPATVHELSVSRLQVWLEASAKTPREQALKVRLRQLLGRG
jgi:hypothetical protein